MIFLFEVHVRDPVAHGAEAYARAWVEASRIIQSASGARGTRLHRAIGRDGVLLAIASWESKSLRDAAEGARDPRVQAIIDAEAEHVEIRIVGEFEDPEWVVLPTGREPDSG